MAKKPIIIANWKMNLSFKETKVLAKNILNQLKKIKKGRKSADFDIVLCPPFMSLPEASKIFGPKKDILLSGAQDCFWEEEGGFTGEISPMRLKELGCSYVILGHSERRQNLGETDEMVHKKVKAALKAKLIPVICLGETMEQRRQGLKEHVVVTQASKALEGINLKSDQKVVLAYEPVWVIGSGRAITPKEAEYMAKVIHQRMIDLFPLPIVRSNIRIIYGGSVDSATIKSFIGQETIDGVLVGGASLKADEFVKMCELML